MDKRPAHFLKIFSSLLLLLFTSQIYAAAAFILPPNHETTYRLEKLDAELGEMKNTLSYKDGIINYTSIATASGLASLFISVEPEEISTLSWPNNHLDSLPQQKSYRYFQDKEHNRNQKMAFSWLAPDKIKVEGIYKNKAYTLNSEKHIWTRQLLPILMSSDLQLNPKITSNSYNIIDKGHIDKYTYTLLATETLKFKDKNHPVLKYKISKPESSRMSYAWLSKDHYYLPLKIEQYKDGKLNASMFLTNLKLPND